MQLRRRMRDLSAHLSKRTDSEVVHLRTLRATIGFLGLALPWALTFGENLRDRLLSSGSEGGQWILEGSISAYYHTGMREIFVAILAALGIFLLCYKGVEKWDVLASKVAGAAAILVALFPTREPSREATDTGGRMPDSVTLFSGPDAADPAIVGTLHYVAAAVFFATVALMALFLFTKTGEQRMTDRKVIRNRVYRATGITIFLAIAAIAVDKLLLGGSLSSGTPFVFWMETVAVTAFGIAWLTKAEILWKDVASDGGGGVKTTMRMEMPEAHRGAPR